MPSLPIPLHLPSTLPFFFAFQRVLHAAGKRSLKSPSSHPFVCLQQPSGVAMSVKSPNAGVSPRVAPPFQYCLGICLNIQCKNTPAGNCEFILGLLSLQLLCRNEKETSSCVHYTLCRFPWPAVFVHLTPSALLAAALAYYTLMFVRCVIKLISRFWICLLYNCSPKAFLNTKILQQQQIALSNIKVCFSLFQRLNCSRNWCLRWWGLNLLGRS